MYGVHSLRERALDAGACTVLGGVCLLGLTHPGDLQCRMLRARAQREETPGRAGAARLEGTHLAMPAGEARPHHHPPLTGVDRPGDHMGWSDPALGQAHRHAPDLLHGPADQRAARPTLPFVFLGGGSWLARWRTTAIMAKASIASETCRCQPCQDRVSL